MPPFHDETPEKVFENILSRRIDWHEGELDVSPEARDFMDRLLCSDADRRLGAGGADEVKAHPFLEGMNWADLLSGEVDFVPKISDPESTDYFDDRGAATQVFSDDDDDHEAAPSARKQPSPRPNSSPLVASATAPALVSASSPGRRVARERAETEPSPHDDFGTFNFRNLPVLKQANDDVIRQMRDQQLLPPLAIPSEQSFARPSPLSKPKSRPGSVDFRVRLCPLPLSGSQFKQWALSNRYHRCRLRLRRPRAVRILQRLGPARRRPLKSPASSHSRRPSEQHVVVDRLRPRQSSTNVGTSATSEHTRRNSLPSRLRRASVSEYDRPPVPDGWGRRRTSANTPPSSLLSSPLEAHEPLPPLSIPSHPPLQESQSAPPVQPAANAPPLAPPARASTIDCLIAGRNPISNKVLETMLVRLGCRCVVVPNGAEAILAAGGVKFDIIWMDLQMPGRSLLELSPGR